MIGVSGRREKFRRFGESVRYGRWGRDKIKAAAELVGRKAADSGTLLTALGEVTVTVAKIFERYLRTGA